ncbi:hypothetical protein Hte_012129 [Hypoxylon texense]
MPAESTIDHYSTLEVEKTATLQDVKDAYRRLALVHHPDKNPENAEAATAAFQKIQIAYETLSDPVLRSNYDARSSSQGSGAQPGPYPQAWPFDDSDDEDEESEVDFRHEFFGGFWFTNVGGHYAASFDRDQRRWREVAREVAREMERDQERLRREKRSQMNAERQQRLDKEAAHKKAKEDAKKQEEEAKAKARDELRTAEKLKQGERWKLLNAETKDEKVKTCLHSEFCTKSQQRQKVKCGACHAKRGITAFQCPHCELLLCQQCVVAFSKKRAAADKQPPPKPKPMSEPAPAPAPKPVTPPKQGVKQQPKKASKKELKQKAKQEPIAEPAAKPAAESAAEAKQNLKSTNRNKNQAQAKPNHPKESKDGKAQHTQGQPKRTCFNCGKEGHTARACTGAPKADSRSCYSCGGKGHISRNCPNNQPRGSGGSRGTF